MARVPTSTQVGVTSDGSISGRITNLSPIPGTPELRGGPVPGAYGEASARAIGGAGRELQQTGLDLSRYVITEATLQNETEATDRSNAALRGMNTATQEYLQLRGDAAVRGFEPFVQRLRDMETAATSETNPAVQRMMRPRIAAHATNVLAGAERWRGDQALNANVQSAAAAADLEMTNGLMARDQPDVMNQALANGLGAVARAGRTRGDTEEAIRLAQQAYTGRFYSNIIESVARGEPGATEPGRAPDPLRAQQIFEANRSRMGADQQLRIQQFLEAPVTQRVASDRAATAIAAPPQNAIRLVPGQDPGAEFNAVQGRIFRVESGGREGAANPNSSARGPGQIVDATWNAYASRLGLRPDQRTDTEAHKLVFRAYMQDAQAAIGRPLNGGEMYAAWFLGIEGFRRFLTASPDANAREAYAAASGGGERGTELAERAQRGNARLWPADATVGQVLNNVYASYGERGGGATFRTDRGDVMRRAIAGTDDNPQLRNAILSDLQRRWSTEDAMNAQERTGLQRRVGEMEQALRTGSPNVTIPRQDILRVFEPAEAAVMLDRLGTAQVSGQVFTAVQFAGPERLNEMRNDLAAGRGTLTDAVRTARGIRVDADGNVHPDDVASDVASRAQLRDVFAQAVSQRQQLIAQNPVSYVSGDPVVAEANRLAQGSTDPRAYEARGTARRAAQRQLGVAQSDVRTLSREESADLAQRIMRLDPAQGDLGAQMQGLASAFGPAEWSRAFADMMRDQSLPSAYMVVANMTNPVGRADMTRMLAWAQQNGGMDRLRQNLSDDARTQIPDLVQNALAPFVRSATALQTNGGQELASRIRGAVTDLAQYYAAFGGRNPQQAVSDAVGRVINDQYTFSGDLRIPRQIATTNGMIIPLDASGVGESLTFVQRRLTANELAPVPESETTRAMTQEARQARMLDAAQRASWVTNESDNGALLMITLDNGGRIPARYASGERIEVRFNDMPQPIISGVGAAPAGSLPRIRPAVAPGSGSVNEIDYDELPSRPRAPDATPAGRQAPAPIAPPEAGPTPSQRRGAPSRGRWIRPDEGTAR